MEPDEYTFSAILDDSRGKECRDKKESLSIEGQLAVDNMFALLDVGERLGKPINKESVEQYALHACTEGWKETHPEALVNGDQLMSFIQREGQKVLEIGAAVFALSHEFREAQPDDIPRPKKETNTSEATMDAENKAMKEKQDVHGHVWVPVGPHFDWWKDVCWRCGCLRVTKPNGEIQYKEKKFLSRLKPQPPTPCHKHRKSKCPI